ncbi:hypothetical protein AB3662_36820 [Sorangium cellulosum]|uniref:hypothetical protein n=1 Tax=Sorangium cellulosum TaxID=56 RepID=UPI003D9A13CA
MALAVQRLVPGSQAVVYDWKAPGVLGSAAHTFDGDSAVRRPLLDMRQLWNSKRYDLDPRDPDANRTVDSDELMARFPEVWTTWREQVLLRHGMWHQLRVTLFEGSRHVAYLALVRERREGAFTPREHALLAGVGGAVRDAAAARRAVGEAPLPSGVLGAMLDAFAEPAFLVNGRGVVVFANGAARDTYPRTPAWVSTAVRADAPASVRARCRTVRMDVEGASLWLVIPKQGAVAPSAGAKTVAWDLPP